MIKHLFKIEYRLVTNNYNIHSIEMEKKSLPTHIIAETDNNAIETALKYQTVNWQLDRCFLQETEVVVLNEELI